MSVVIDFGADTRSLSAAEPRGRGFGERRPAAAASRAEPVRRGPVDHGHLARYTLGNADLELEVLELFVGEAPRTLAGMQAAAAAEVIVERDWHMGSHTLKGSARAVGAWRVAELAEAAEEVGEVSRAILLGHVAALERAILEVIGHVSDLKLQKRATP